MSLNDFDKDYRDNLMRLPESLALSYRLLIEAGEWSLDDSALSEALLLRMNAFYRTQAAMKEFLGKKVATAAADFFVEAVLFYLKTFIEIHQLSLRAFSELRIEKKRGSARPDISIWHADEMAFAIECKTQLGWNRTGWAKDFDERRQRFQLSFPNSQTFLVVLTGLNWKGFENHPNLGGQLFVLSKLWPTYITSENVKSAIHTPVELLFKSILERSKSCSVPSK